jgi:sRNA-binding carbon storage regulator CsrA
MGWLSLARRDRERIRIGPDIWIELDCPGRVLVKVKAPPDVSVQREELLPLGEQLAAVERRERAARYAEGVG